jgi:hypothetical protein
MNFSETIIAAMIGAGATVATATFQLFMAFRSRKADYKPKRGSGLRSMLAVCGLVLGAAVAGFGYSELRVQGEREQSTAMEQRIADRLQALADAQLAQLRNGNFEAATRLAAAHGTPVSARSEAMAQVSACHPQTPGYGGDPVGCDAENTNRVALCASVPAQASVREVLLFARADGESAPWETSRVSVDQDIGGARFVGSSYEVAQDADRKAVCARFSQWNSEHGHVARVVVLYTTGAAMAAPAEPGPAPPRDDGLPGRAVDAGTGAVSTESVTPDIAPPDPARGAAQAVVAAQP